MYSIHDKIVLLLKKELIFYYKITEQDLTKSKLKFKKELFKNYKSNPDSGLLLTDLGFSFLSSKHQYYKFSFKKNSINMKHLLWLENNTKFPYYCELEFGLIYLFCPDTALLFKLYGTNLDLILTNSLK